MAEALVYLVIKRASSVLVGELVKALISSQLGKEASLLIQVESRIRQIMDEFEVMQAFLNEAQQHEAIDKTTEAWLKQVRKIAHEVEDTIDEYAYLTTEQYTGLTGFLKKSFNRSKAIVDWHNMATRLKEIEIRLRNLSTMKDRYSIKIRGESSGLNRSGGMQRNQVGYTYLLDQDNPVGIREEREQLIQWLTEERPERTTVTVWGMGGLGKTTLVRNVYNNMDIKRHFDCQAWISVSQKYEVEDILRRIIKEVSATKDAVHPNIGSMDQRELVEFVQNILQKKRCLVILDDVWTRDDWSLIVDSFLENNSASRVVITTRNMDVARLATGGRVINLRYLQKEEAWVLFCRRAFCNEEDKRCPRVLEKWGKLITEKCEGLPLALVAVGSLLSYSIKEENEWKKFYEKFNWETDGNTETNWVAKILNLSYNELPVYLKNCFLYCSNFPEDYLIKRKRIVRLWIAEGFIEARGSQTLEEVAEDHLNELIHRCMLQVVQRNHFGRVAHCQMHDLIRELTVTVSAKENFCLMYGNTESEILCEEARRLSVHRITNSIHLGNGLPRLRSLLVFDKAQPFPSLMSALPSTSRFLRVLDLQDAMIERVPDEVGNLFNLHYLGLRRTKVKKLPKSFEKLINLQTLDLVDSEIEKLPNMSKLRNLRHLFAERISDPTGRALDVYCSARTPRGLCNLRCLQTLQSVEAGRSLLQQLGKLTQLRSFRITKLRGIHCAELWASTANMPYLSTLYVHARDEEEVLHLQGFNPQNQQLQRLTLRGRLEGGVVPLTACFPSLGNTLRRLHLSWSGLREDPLPHLSRLSNLGYLNLTNVYDGEELCFRAGWFPNLRVLLLFDLKQLCRIEVEKGSMEDLRRLSLRSLSKLESLPRGIQLLASLQQLFLIEISTKLKEKLKEGKIVDQIRHIPEIRCRD